MVETWTPGVEKRDSPVTLLICMIVYADRNNNNKHTIKGEKTVKRKILNGPFDFFFTTTRKDF